MPTAIYGFIPRKVISMGLMTAAALIPAKPVPNPAPIPAKKQMINLYNIAVTSYFVFFMI